jgi:hypothetical protein
MIQPISACQNCQPFPHQPLCLTIKDTLIFARFDQPIAPVKTPAGFAQGSLSRFMGLIAPALSPGGFLLLDGPWRCSCAHGTHAYVYDEDYWVDRCVSLLCPSKQITKIDPIRDNATFDGPQRLITVRCHRWSKLFYPGDLTGKRGRLTIFSNLCQ